MPEQVWPELAKPPQSAPPTAFDRLASASTSIGSLPPSSSTEPFIRSAHATPTPRPTSTEPVKKIFAALDSTSAWPTAPPPCTVRTSPSGRPARSNTRWMRCADQRGERRGLQHHAVAAHQRDRHLAERDRPRVVPRGDHADHAERLVRELRALLLEEDAAGRPSRRRGSPARRPRSSGGRRWSGSSSIDVGLVARLALLAGRAARRARRASR